MSEPAQMDLQQLLALVGQSRQKQDALSELAGQQVSGQPMMNPGQTMGQFLMGRGNTQAQGRGLNAFYTSILNRDKSKQTFGGAAGEGFERGAQLMDDIRGRSHAEKMQGAAQAAQAAQQELKNSGDVYGAQQTDVGQGLTYSAAMERARISADNARLGRESAEGISAANRVSREAIELAKLTQKKEVGSPLAQELKTSQPGRLSSIEKAQKFIDSFESGAESGTSRKAAGYLPGVWTDQGAFDQELDAFAESAARARLKALGDARPTDADVKGMKESLFGVGKDEQVNKNLLQEFLAEQVDIENQYRNLTGEEPLGTPDPQNKGKGYYNSTFGQGSKTTQPKVIDFNSLPD